MVTAVNICGIPYTVEYVKDDFDADTHFGQITYAKGKIKINKDMPPAIIKETICHEMVHGMFVHLGYNEIANDEQFVQALANAISQGFEIKNLGCEANVNK